VVEITPIGIQNLGWKFWLIFLVLNAAFLPIFYFFYPETADRTLEDMDEYFRSNPSVIVIRDKDAISSKRPLKYKEKEQVQIRTVEQEETGVRRVNSKVADAPVLSEKV